MRALMLALVLTMFACGPISKPKTSSAFALAVQSSVGFSGNVIVYDLTGVGPSGAQSLNNTYVQVIQPHRVITFWFAKTPDTIIVDVPLPFGWPRAYTNGVDWPVGATSFRVAF